MTMAVRASVWIGTCATLAADSACRSPRHCTTKPMTAVTKPAVTQANSSVYRLTWAMRSASWSVDVCACASRLAAPSDERPMASSSTRRRREAASSQALGGAAAATAGAPRKRLISAPRRLAKNPVHGCGAIDARRIGGALARGRLNRWV
jgi:hypothetical protein